MPKTKIQNAFFSRNFFLLLFVLSFAFSPSFHPAQAWDALPANAWLFSAETVQKIINGIQMGAAKQAAVLALQQEATALVTGKSSGGPMFVSDWGAYLVKQPQADVNIYMNAYIDNAVNGRGSLKGYVAKGAEGIGGNSSYPSQLAQMAKKLTTEQPTLKMTYTGDPSRMFADPKNAFRNLNLYLSGINNPWAFNINMQVEAEKKKTELEKIAQTKVIAGQGFTGKESNGMTVTPGVLIKDQISKVQTMGMDVVTNATNVQEVIASLASSMINQTMMQGIGQMQAIVHKEVTDVRSKAGLQTNNAVRTQGPGALYGNGSTSGSSGSQVQCNSCLNACSTSYPDGGQALTDCQTACAPQCGGN